MARGDHRPQAAVRIRKTYDALITVHPMDTPDPVLEAVKALRATGIIATPCGDDLERWQIGDFVMSDADVLRLAESRRLMDGPDRVQ